MRKCAINLPRLLDNHATLQYIYSMRQETKGKAMTSELIHPFEAAELGKAPFRFDGLTENVYSVTPGHSQPGGVCKFCGHSIRYEFWVVSTDGKRFDVGSECIRKVAAKGSPLRNAAERELRDQKRTAKHQRLMVRAEAAAAALERDETLLANRPHPHPAYADRLTFRNYAEWMLQNAGDAGQTQICKIIEAAMEVRQ